MDYAERLARPSTRTMVVPVVALVIGAAAATGVYALIDNGGDAIQAATRVIVVETPAQHSADIPGKNETATAAAISPTAGVSATDEAATAAAIVPDADTQPRGSKASSTGTSEQGAAEALRTDPHGPAVSLRNP
jgi:hypothetical protein